MSGNRFDQIAQEILKQKQFMDELEAENRELREQIADLRTGRGIFVDILGTRSALRDDSSLVQTAPASSAPVPSTSMVANATPATTRPLDNYYIAHAPTAETPAVSSQPQEQSVQEQVSPQGNGDDKPPTSDEFPFLEEILVDEFASALTSPKAVWQDPAEKKQPKQQPKPEDPIDEKQKEVLRRELMGSFLLE